MPIEKKGLHISNVDHASEGLIVRFSDGTTALFHTQFLYDARNDNSNRVLPLENGEAPVDGVEDRSE